MLQIIVKKLRYKQNKNLNYIFKENLTSDSGR